MTDKILSTDDLLKRADDCRATRRYKEAETLCRQALQYETDNIQALYLLGLINKDIGRFSDAIQLLRKVIELDATQPKYHKDIADTHALLGNTEQAVHHYRLALDLKHDYFEVHANLASILLKTGHPDEALVHDREAVRLRPDIAALHDNFGNTLRINGDLESAVHHHEQALRLDPKMVSAYVNLGRALLALKRMDKAASSFERALQLEPNSPAIHYNLAEVLSGLRKLDPALSHFRRAIELDPRQPAYHKDIADTYASLGDAERAIHHYRQALELKNDYFEVHANLGGLLLRAGRVDEALVHDKEALHLRPDIAALHDNLGHAFRVSGDPKSAVPCHQQALRLNPTLLAAYVNLGNALLELGRTEEAVRSLEQALELEPKIPEAHCTLGNARINQKKFELALMHYTEALRLRPDFMEAVIGRFTAFLKTGDRNKALKCIEPYAEMRRRNSRFALAASRLVETDNQRRASVDELEHLLEQGLTDKLELRRVLFRLGDLHDELHSFDEAFGYYQRANQLKSEPFQREKYRRYVDQLISEFTQQRLQILPKATSVSELPVFIVGMPRAGKTLTEQILASHPEVTGAGELSDISDIFQAFQQRTGKSFQALIETVSTKQLDDLAKQYLEKREREAFPGTTRVIDTMPENVHYLGFIKMLFPRARIIHCRRDPRDTCLECFFKNFRLDHRYADDLGNLGFRFHHYQRLSRHWQETLPLMEVYYEKLVEKPEEISRRIVDFLGLEWDPRCLEFHNSGKARVTGSQEFFEPINNRSVGRWKHYERHLQPLFEELYRESGKTS